jgi:uncharacterized protein (TIGR03545 family)
MIRWKAVVPLVVLAAGWAVFSIFFLDFLVKRAIECGGTRAAGAKVEVGAVKVSLLKSSVLIQGLQVADRDDPWKNLFEIGAAEFDYAFEPLLEKKLLIREMSVQGLRWGTPRKTSGEWKPAPKKPSALAQMASNIPLPQTNLPDLKNLDWKSQVDPSRLQSLKQIEDAKAKAADFGKQWQDRIAALDVQSSVQQVESAAKAVSGLKVSGPQDLPRARQTLEDLKTAREALSAKLREADELKKSLDRELSSAKDSLRNAESLKDMDARAVMEKMNLPDLSARGIGRSLFGPVWISKLDTALQGIRLVRKYMPAKKDREAAAKLPPPARREGLTFTFPGRRALPKLLIEKISVAGSTEKTRGEADALEFSGTITGVTSDPALYGRPLEIALKGARQGTPLSCALRGTLDHTGDIAKDSFEISASGLDLSGRQFADSGPLSAKLRQGRADGTLKLTFAGEEIDAALSAKAGSLQFPASDAVGGIEGIISKALSGASSLSVRAQARGTSENLDFSVDTDIDELISKQFKSIVGGEVDKIKAQVSAQIEAQIAQRRKDAQAALDAQGQSALSKLGEKNALLGQQGGRLSSLTSSVEQQIKSQAGGALKDGLKGLFKP